MNGISGASPIKPGVGSKPGSDPKGVNPVPSVEVPVTLPADTSPYVSERPDPAPKPKVDYGTGMPIDPAATPTAPAIDTGSKGLGQFFDPVNHPWKFATTGLVGGAIAGGLFGASQGHAGTLAATSGRGALVGAAAGALLLGSLALIASASRNPTPYYPGPPVIYEPYPDYYPTDPGVIYEPYPDYYPVDPGPIYYPDPEPYYPEPYYPDPEPYYPDPEPYYPDPKPYYPDPEPYYPDNSSDYGNPSWDYDTSSGDDSSDYGNPDW